MSDIGGIHAHSHRLIYHIDYAYEFMISSYCQDKGWSVIIAIVYLKLQTLNTSRNALPSQKIRFTN